MDNRDRARPERQARLPGLVIARWGICGGAVSAFLTLLGWILDKPDLTSFGMIEPSLPFSSVAYLFMAAGFGLYVSAQSHRLARLLLIVPIAIGAARLVTLPSLGLGIDGWLFVAEVNRSLAGPATPPGIIHALVLIGLPLAIMLTPVATRRAGYVTLGIAGSALAFASLSLLFVPMAEALDAAGWRLFSTSLPAAIETLLLALGVLAWRSDIDVAAGLSSPEWRVMRLVVPLLMVEPVLASLAEFGAVEAGWVTPLWGEMSTIALNFAAIAILLAWSMRSAAKRRAALVELSQALDAAPMALIDADGRIVHWSRGCEDLYGWSEHEALGRAKHELLDSRAPGGAAAPRARHADVERELVERCRDDRLVHVIEHARPVANSARGAVLVLSMTDIGARLKAEAALRASEDRLALTATAHEIGLFEWDVASGRLTWAAGSEQRLGIIPGTIQDFESWAALVDPEDLADIQRTISAAVATRADRISYTYRLSQANGVRRALEGSARCFYDRAGNLVKTVGLTLDITRHEEREAALLSQEAQLRSILETVPDAMVVIDERGQIRSFSAAAEQMFGYCAADAIGSNVATLIPDDDAKRHDRYLRRYLRAGARSVIGDRRLLTAKRVDGSIFPIELHVGEARVAGERVFTGFVRDISDRIAAEERLGQVHQELMHVVRLNAVGEMAAALAHELNQPLSAIANFVATGELLLDVPDGQLDQSRLREMLHLANAQALRAGDIIHRLREFVAKRESDMRIEPVETTLREAAALLAAGSQRPDIRVTFALSRSADVMLADRIQIQQVMVNLIRNAFEVLAGMPPDRREVTIGSRRLSPSEIEISVRDQGPGLSDAVLSRLFTPFTSSKGEGGMGIGLSICRRIVEAHGGMLTASNMPDGGACFRFTLPCVRPR